MEVPAGDKTGIVIKFKSFLKRTDKRLETWLIAQESLLLQKTHMAAHSCLYRPLSLLASMGTRLICGAQTYM